MPIDRGSADRQIPERTHGPATPQPPSIDAACLRASTFLYGERRADAGLLEPGRDDHRASHRPEPRRPRSPSTLFQGISATGAGRRRMPGGPQRWRRSPACAGPVGQRFRRCRPDRRGHRFFRIVPTDLQLIDNRAATRRPLSAQRLERVRCRFPPRPGIQRRGQPAADAGRRETDQAALQPITATAGQTIVRQDRLTSSNPARGRRRRWWSGGRWMNGQIGVAAEAGDPVRRGRDHARQHPVSQRQRRGPTSNFPPPCPREGGLPRARGGVARPVGRLRRGHPRGRLRQARRRTAADHATAPHGKRFRSTSALRVGGNRDPARRSSILRNDGQRVPRHLLTGASIAVCASSPAPSA